LSEIFFLFFQQPPGLSETLQKLFEQQRDERRTMQQGLVSQHENLLCSFEREVKLTLAVSLLFTPIALLKPWA